MYKLMKGIIIAGCCGLVAVAGVAAGYGFMNRQAALEKPGQTEKHAESNVPAAVIKQPEVTEAETASMDVVLPHTQVTYEYYYTVDGKTETSEETAPYFMLNMNEEKFKEVFSDWEIVSFSSDKVVMRKEVDEESSQHYIVGVMDGYITVFYQKPINGTTLKEVTETPVSALSQDEQKKLEEGVLVSGEGELLRILEDYSS